MATVSTSAVESTKGRFLTSRGLAFATLWILSLAVFRQPLAALLQLAWSDERYTQVLFVPFISGFLIWFDRRRIVPYAFAPRLGLALIFASAAMMTGQWRWRILGSSGDLPVSILAMVVAWVGIAAFVYGAACSREIIFPVLLFVFFIPLPPAIMTGAEISLQKGSADVSAALLRVAGMPYLREGVLFAIPGVTIKVAEECSGIRSSLSLLLAGIVAGHLLLDSGRSQTWFALFIIPVAIFKNAVRIVTIAWLGVYVDRGYFFGVLHHYGGFPFSVIAFAILGALLWLLRRRSLPNSLGGNLNGPSLSLSTPAST